MYQNNWISVRNGGGDMGRREGRRRDTLQIVKMFSWFFLNNHGLKCEVAKCKLITTSGLVLRNFFQA